MKAGDVMNRDTGAILGVRDEPIMYGYVVMTPDQANEAKKYGWSNYLPRDARINGNMIMFRLPDKEKGWVPLETRPADGETKLLAGDDDRPDGDAADEERESSES